MFNDYKVNVITKAWLKKHDYDKKHFFNNASALLTLFFQLIYVNEVASGSDVVIVYWK